MLTDEQARELDGYLRELADILHLKDWRILLGDEPTDDKQADAHVHVTYGRKRATVYVAHDWLEFDAERQRHDLVHELIHVHLQPLTWNLNGAQRLLGDTAFGLLEDGHKDAIEHATDGLADAVAPLLPLPPWARKDDD